MDARNSTTVFAALTACLTIGLAPGLGEAPVAAASRAPEPLRALLAPPHADDRVIVGFEPATTQRARRAALASVASTSVAASPMAGRTVVVRLTRDRSVRSAVRMLRGRPGIAYVEPDYHVEAAAGPGDPYYANGQLWGMYGDATSPHANPFGSGAGEAWAAGAIGSPDVAVGIIDEGVRITHPDLAANVWANPWELPNGVDDDGNGYVDDIHGWDFAHDDASVFDGAVDDHGTHVAGIVGARGGNGLGVAGVSWQVTLVPAKFLGPRGGYVSDAIRAIDYLTDLKIRHGLDIVATNNSWSGGGFSHALDDAIERAGDAGILFVAAAGNEGRDLDASPAYPAAYECTTRANGSPRGWDCVIAVAALRPDGARRSDSSWGRRQVDLGAPGADVVSTHPTAVDGYGPSGGTSMATAHVAGAAALCRGVDGSLSAPAIRERILGTTAHTAALAGRTVTSGRLDVGALAMACVPPALPRAILVDDRDPAFRRTGSGWKEVPSGYAGSHSWVPAQASTTKRHGAWRPILEAGGDYEIFARIPAGNAWTRRATYRIRTADGWVSRARSQAKWQGKWVSLGLHRLTDAPIVQLADVTGEAADQGRRVAYDAARFIPVALMSAGS